MMSNYVVVYDMTPYEERNGMFIQIGIGEKDPYHNIGLFRYQPISQEYSPAKEEQDQSKIISPWENQYGSSNPSLPPPSPGQPIPDQPSDHDSKHDHDKGFLKDNLVLVIIVAASVFILITLLTCCCCKKNGEKDVNEAYMNRTYSKMSEERPT